MKLQFQLEFTQKFNLRLGGRGLIQLRTSVTDRGRLRWAAQWEGERGYMGVKGNVGKGEVQDMGSVSGREDKAEADGMGVGEAGIGTLCELIAL